MKKLFSCCFPRKEEDITSKELQVKNDKRTHHSQDIDNNISKSRQISKFGGDEPPFNITNRKNEKESAVFQLREIEGNMLNSEVISISQYGMIGGLRNQRDGYTYFGYKKMNSFNKIINDFVLSNPTNIVIDTEHVFKIFYNNEKKRFYLSGDNFTDDNCVVFLKLPKPFKIQRKHLISLGDLHLSIEVENNNLKLEIVYLNEETKTKVFTPENKTVKIGRQKDNDIYLENYAYSRVHTTFFYDVLESSWYIMDGTEGKPSTNGTWIILDFVWEVEDHNIFRISNSLMILEKI